MAGFDSSAGAESKVRHLHQPSEFERLPQGVRERACSGCPVGQVRIPQRAHGSAGSESNPRPDFQPRVPRSAEVWRGRTGCRGSGRSQSAWA